MKRGFAGTSAYAAACGGDRCSSSRCSFVLPAYHHGVLARIMVLAVFAMGYNLLFGYTGLLSLGHAMFFSAGLYGAGLTMHASRLGRAGRRSSPARRRRAAGAASSACWRCAPPASPS